MSNCRRKLRILTLPNECVSKDLEYEQDNDSEGDSELDNGDCSRIEYSGKDTHGMDNKKINHSETVTNRTIDQYGDAYDKVLSCNLILPPITVSFKRISKFRYQFHFSIFGTLKSVALYFIHVVGYIFDKCGCRAAVKYCAEKNKSAANMQLTV
uniref:Uncharacterized protein n=1 Tax=Glossina austeni TaxID=7395 RepID=A0A1A9VPP7_GLOAU